LSGGGAASRRRERLRGARESKEGGGGARRAAAARGGWRRGERATRDGMGVTFRSGWFARRVELYSACGSRSANFATQDGANARAGKVFGTAPFSRARWRSARALPRGKPAVNLPRERFGASVGDALSSPALHTCYPAVAGGNRPTADGGGEASSIVFRFFGPRVPFQTPWIHLLAGGRISCCTRLPSDVRCI
jgi:hypothetical protein